MKRYLTGSLNLSANSMGPVSITNRQLFAREVQFVITGPFITIIFLTFTIKKTQHFGIINITGLIDSIRYLRSINMISSPL